MTASFISDERPTLVMISTCEHIYCRACLIEWLHLDESCPDCQIRFHPDNLTEPNRFFSELYGKLRIDCDFVRAGCRETLIMSQLSAHLPNCAFRHVGLIDVVNNDWFQVDKIQLGFSKKAIKVLLKRIGKEEALWPQFVNYDVDRMAPYECRKRSERKFRRFANEGN